MIRAFDAEAIQHWMAGLGISSYVGSSGRIFPLEMKAAPLLRAWLARLKQKGVQFFYRHQWLGWAENGQLQFKHAGLVSEKPASAVVLATGGGSWRRLGSDAAWVQVLQQQGVQVQPLQASNVGVQVAWSVFMQTLGGQPLKRVKAWVNLQQAWQGEAVISHYGLEGGLIYKLSRDLRQQLNSGQPAMFYLDLLPDMSLAQLQQKLQAGGKQSLTNIWRKAGLDTVKSGLLREYLPKAEWTDSKKVAALAKGLPVSIQGLQPVDEAISTAGGVGLSGIDTNRMLQVKPGVFCCGEMLDWDAPTGGYLLTACLATGRQAGLGVGAWLQANTSDECLYE
jgi:uncharacterized flavoprotein (TIGR03862 family)